MESSISRHPSRNVKFIKLSNFFALRASFACCGAGRSLGFTGVLCIIASLHIAWNSRNIHDSSEDLESFSLLKLLHIRVGET